MRDYKSSLLILLSVLLLISTAMLFTALYHFYFKGPVPVTVVSPAGKPAIDTVPAKLVLSDSFSYPAASDSSRPLTYVSTALQDADSLRDGLASKLEDFYKLRNEIKLLLDHRDSSSRSAAGEQKIKELQDKIAALRYVNMDVEKENRRLNALLDQLKGGRQQTKTATQTPARLENIAAPTTSSAGSLFLLYDLRFAAFLSKNSEETETSKAALAEKLGAVFRVKSQGMDDREAEVVVMVIKPDGSVLQQSAWEAGMFETPDGKKVYSKKIRFDYTRGEPKQLRFSLEAEKFERGMYTLKIYHHGRLIGKIAKLLS